MCKKTKNINRKNPLKRLLIFSAAAAILFGAFGFILNSSVPDEISVFSGENIKNRLGALSSVIQYEEPSVTVSSQTQSEKCFVGEEKISAKLFGLIPIKETDVKVYKDIKLYAGGIPFGIKMQSEGVCVIGITDVSTEYGVCSPASDSGIKTGDIILEINKIPINSINDVTEAVNASNGKTLEFLIERNKEKIYFSVTPVLSENGKYKTGICIKDCTAGIGTVTYIDPETLNFAGLGHGICDPLTGEPINFKKGSVMEVAINGVNKGKSGTPGEIKGFFTSKCIGRVSLNISSGIYGKFYSLPNGLISKSPIAIALKDEVREGDATIYSTLSDGDTKEYKIRIDKINSDSSSLKSFLIEVTDEELIAKTGGIIQGMSGSPIMQNGKIIGAVTHVLINDPTKGYGISIENMLQSECYEDEIAA